MVSMMIFNSRKNEGEAILKMVRQMAARLTEEKWEIENFSKEEEITAYLKDSPLMDMTCYDVAPKGSIDYLEKIRRQYRESLLLLVAEPTMSPMEYIRPTILASSLLLRPIRAEQLEQSLSSLIGQYMERYSGGEEESLAVETREGTTYIPFSKIYYFEAREKKIYIRMKKQELSFYDTIEQLAERLPEHFARCHRSFIVNRSRIRKVMLSQNLMELEDGMMVPLSRSYKPDFKELK
jgi:DNA-binding LytR/AlgR family response regulator